MDPHTDLNGDEPEQLHSLNTPPPKPVRPEQNKKTARWFIVIVAVLIVAFAIYAYLDFRKPELKKTSDLPVSLSVL